jgi:hypothetical protein
MGLDDKPQELLLPAKSLLHRHYTYTSALTLTRQYLIQ